MLDIFIYLFIQDATLQVSSYKHDISSRVKNSVGPDQLASHLCSLINAIVIHSLKSIIAKQCQYSN